MVIVPADQFTVNVNEKFIDTLNQIKHLPEAGVYNAPSDTGIVCLRTGFSGITFYNTDNVMGSIDLSVADSFPFLFTKINMQKEQETRSILVKHLKDGKELPAIQFHDDWIILVLLFTAICYAVLRTFSKNLFSELRRFFVSRGLNEPGSRDISSLFHWESTLFNLASFLNIALFSYFVIVRYNMLPEDFSGFPVWVSAFFVISLILTIRHLICLTAGNISDERDAFSEYIVVVYQWYRVIGLLSFLLVVLVSYTTVLPSGKIFIFGFASFGLAYLLRIFRLFKIFLKRGVSIFYLILYLCALEILPVLISFKYFTGLA